MNLEELMKQIMGDNYKEELTQEEIQDFFKKQVLAGGEYTNTGKANAEKKELEDKINSLKKELESKMTDDDKKKKADEDTKKLIEDLQKQLMESKATQSKMSANSLLAEARIKAGVKDNDTEYDDFISNISFEDSDKTNNIGKYIAKLVNNAYESGKSEAVKNKLGKMGSFKEGQDDGKSGDNGDEKGSFGKELAQSTKVEVKGEKDFFERK